MSRQLVAQIREFVRRGLRPRSPSAFAFAALCVAVAALVRLAIDLVAPGAVPFATFFPAILAAALVGGVAAGIAATLLSAFTSDWMFVPPRFSLAIPRNDDLVSMAMFIVAAAAIIWIAEQYRAAVRRLNEEEHYRKIVVDELGHRVKNKLATIYAILRHELRRHPAIWDSVSGRLRALSAADDFLEHADSHGVELQQILEMELEPYGTGRYNLRGEPVQLYAKLPTVLALVFHELATNAAKYGALSTPGGRLDIAWRSTEGRIMLDWVEIGGPPVTAPQRRSFGTNLIERSLGGFGGSAKLEFKATGVVCRLELPSLNPPQANDAAPPPAAMTA